MAEVSAIFEAGVQGATIQVADTAAGTAWTAVTSPAGGTRTYDNAHAYGNLAAKIANGGTDAANYLQWEGSAGTLSDHYGRIYFYFTANYSGFVRVVDWFNSGGSRCAALGLNTDGTKFTILDSASTIQGTMTSSIALNQWIRVEYHIVNNASTGTFELKLFNNPDSPTPTETLLVSSLNLSTNTYYYRYGLALGGTNIGPFWMDNIIAGATGYPGPSRTMIKKVGPIGVGVEQAASTTHVITVGAGQGQAGNLAVLRFSYHSFSATITSIVDSRGNTWNFPASLVYPAPVADNITTAIAYSNLATSLQAGDTITITLSASVSAHLYGAEFSGIVGVGALDQAGKSQRTTAGTAWAVTAGTTTQPDELLVAIASGAAGNRTSVQAEPWIEEYEALAAIDNSLAAYYRIVTEPGVYTSSGTYSGTESGLSVIGAFKGNGSVAVPQTGRFVQELASLNLTAGSGSTQAITLTGTAQARNTVILIFACRDTSTSGVSVADSRGNTWTVDGGPLNTANDFVMIASTRQDVATLRSGDTVTITFGTAPNQSRLALIEEFTGIIRTATPAVATANNGTASSVNVGDTGTTATLTKAGGVVISAFCVGEDQSGNVGRNLSGTVGTFSGFPAGQALVSTPSDFPKTLIAGYQIPTTTSGRKEAVSWAGTATGYQGLIVSYRPDSYMTQVLADSPNAYWRMGESSGLPQDSSGNAMHMVATVGAPTYSQPGALTGDGNTAIKFTTSDDFFRGDNALLDLADVFTLEAWVKRSSTGALHSILSKSVGAYYWGFDTDDKIRLNKSDVAVIVKSTTAITDTTTWHHLVATKSGATVKLYQDGVDVTGTVTNATFVDNAFDLYLNADSDGVRGDQTLDEIALYPTALSAARVLAHYQARMGPEALLTSDINALSALGL